MALEREPLPPSSERKRSSVDCQQYFDLVDSDKEPFPINWVNSYRRFMASNRIELTTLRKLILAGILSNHDSPLRPKRFVTRKIVQAAAEIAMGKPINWNRGDTSIASRMPSPHPRSDEGTGTGLLLLGPVRKNYLARLLDVSPDASALFGPGNKVAILVGDLNLVVTSETVFDVI